MKPSPSFRVIVVAALLAASPHALAATLRPADCFRSHMVVQRDMPLPIWGAATPDTTVKVEFGAARGETKADAAGRWRVVLPRREACSEPQSLVVRGAGQSVTFDDVLVGEVWLCAGQSNMLMPLAKAAGAKQQIAAADRGRLRLFQFETAAGGDPGPYSSKTIAALDPTRYGRGSWRACTPQSASGFSAVGYFFGARLLEELDVPVGILAVAVGGTPTEAWVCRDSLAAHPATRPLVTGNWLENRAIDGWCQTRARENLARARAVGETIPGDDVGPNHPFKPGFMWESGVAPLVPLAIRGAVWYQGESNADSPARVEQHDHLFPLLVADWRRAWGRDDLPFGVVQLPGMNRPDWPAFRDGQRRLAESIGGVGLVVTIDLGTPDDVHPRDKQPVGERLATWALATAYGRDGPATGPRPIAAERAADGTVAVRFVGTGGRLLTTDALPPRHFEVAGEDRVFVAASCHIDGDSVVVTAPGPAPRGGIRHVRYAWASFPRPGVNLVGKTGLPATPFALEAKAAGGR